MEEESPEADARLRAAGLAGDLLVLLPAIGIVVLRQMTGRAEGKGGFRLVLFIDAVTVVLLAVLIILAPVLFKRAKRRKETNQKVLSLLRREMRWLILAVNILYWQMYRFWK